MQFLRSRVGGVIADVEPREDPIDRLLDGAECVDGPGVEGTRPGVGQQDLPLEREPVQRECEPAVDRR